MSSVGGCGVVCNATRSSVASNVCTMTQPVPRTLAHVENLQSVHKY